MPESAARVLVCEDEAGLRHMLEVLLRRAGYQVSVAADAEQAVQMLGKVRPDVVLTDLVMTGASGMAVLEAALRWDAHLQVLLMTAFATTEQAVEAMRQGAYDYLQKPFKNQQLLAALEKAVEKRSILLENKTLKERLQANDARGGMIGESAAMQRVRALVERAAKTPSSVLITGESGTGKEMVARALHALGERAAKPFVALNCGALPETLMESELFGHERGAFTHALSSREGLFQAATGGTLLLDEVGDLPPALQVKLLRALQERKVRPLGASKEIEVDVRVIAATNRPIEQDVEAGTFRSDLFYRLHVIRIDIPPLRQRPEDIAPLALHLARKHALNLKRPLQLRHDALAWLAAQPLPGNVRELENLIERVATLSDRLEISASELQALSCGAAHLDAEPASAENCFDLDTHLGKLEKQLLVQALNQAQGVRTVAAKRLGMTLRSLRYRLAKYGFDEEAEPS